MKNVTYYEPFPPPPCAILNTGKQPEIKREAVLSCLNSVNLEQQPLLPSLLSLSFWKWKTETYIVEQLPTKPEAHSSLPH